MFEMKASRRDSEFWVPPTNPLINFTDEELWELSYIVKLLKDAIDAKDYFKCTFTTFPRVAQVLRNHTWYVKKHSSNMFEIRSNLRNSGEQLEAKKILMKRGK